MLDLVTLGEALAVFIPEAQEPFERARTFIRTVGGAEVNVAAGLARLGFRTGWIGRVGADPFGRAIIKALRAEGVDVSQVRVEHGAPTGIYFRESRPDRDPSVYDYRRGAAGSRIGAEDIDPSYIGSARLLHITGITLALSPSAREAVVAAVAAARERSVPVAMDPNLRLKLWSAADAAANLRPLLAHCDLILVGLEEGELLCGRRGERAVAEWFLAAGARIVVIKLGAQGALATDGDRIWQAPGFAARVVDTVGAGDAFAVGFYAAWLERRSLEECLRWGNAAGALAVQVVGDLDALAVREEIESLLGRPPIPPR